MKKVTIWGGGVEYQHFVTLNLEEKIFKPLTNSKGLTFSQKNTILIVQTYIQLKIKSAKNITAWVLTNLTPIYCDKVIKKLKNCRHFSSPSLHPIRLPEHWKRWAAACPPVVRTRTCPDFGWPPGSATRAPVADRDCTRFGRVGIFLAPPP